MSEPIQRHHTSARMSKIVRHGGLVFLCGQTATRGKSVTIADQTREVLGKIDALLTQAGTDRERILSATLYIKSMNDFAAMNVVWEDWIPPGAAPARTTVEASLAAPELLIEITVIAAA
ncbi:MAG TPA: RidA family protein [Paralcaligenes sp.]